jgi:hypothetical protein
MLFDFYRYIFDTKTTGWQTFANQHLVGLTLCLRQECFSQFWDSLIKIMTLPVNQADKKL